MKIVWIYSNIVFEYILGITIQISDLNILRKEYSDTDIFLSIALILIVIRLHTKECIHTIIKIVGNFSDNLKNIVICQKLTIKTSSLSSRKCLNPLSPHKFFL